MKKIAVIGAGITGITTAYQLMKKGYDVTVFDKQKYAAMETSYANGGQLSACNGEVWTNWKTIYQGIQWIFKKDAPLSINLKPSLHKIGWFLSFLSNVKNHEKNTIATVKMAIESGNLLKELLKDENINFDFKEKGILHLCNTEENFNHGLKVNKWLTKAGLKREPLNNNEIQKIEPTINLDNFFGGFFTKSDMSGDIHLFCTQLAEICKKNNVKFNYNTSINDIVHKHNLVELKFSTQNTDNTDTFDATVICAGVSSKFIASKLGDNVNIYPVKGYSITIDLNDKISQKHAPEVSLLDDGAKIVSSRLGINRFRIAGTAEFNGYNKDIREDRILPLIKWSNKLFPKVSTEHYRPWAGLRPMTPNMMPKIGKGKLPGIFYNTGHGHLGWTLSAFSSLLISDILLRTDNLN